MATTTTSAVTTPIKPISSCRGNEAENHDLVVRSAVYKANERVTVHLTPCATRTAEALPVLYLLHGSGGGANESQWPDLGLFTEVDAAVMAGTFPPALVVVPDAEAAYTCSDCQADLTVHLLKEIEPRLAAFGRIDTGDRAIGGISAGGGLALSVAAHHPGDFVAVGAHSPVEVPEADLDVLAQHLPVYLDVGASDDLAASTKQMSDYLEKRGGNVKLSVNPGDHNHAYWRAHMPAYVDFYGSHLR